MLSESDEAEKKMAAGAFVSQALLQSYVRARTDKPAAEKGDALKHRVDQLKGKPYAIHRTFFRSQTDPQEEWQQPYFTFSARAENFWAFHTSI